jgi:hypothetical protein
MTFFSKVGSFNTGTAAAGNTVVVSGLGFQPKVIFFWFSGELGTVDVAQRDTHHRGFGVGISTTDRRAAGTLAQDTPTSMVTNQVQTDAALIAANSTSDTNVGRMDLQSMDSDGFTLIVDTAFNGSYRIHYLALGGTDITDVVGGEVTAPAGTGTQDITSLSFQPDFLLVFGVRSTNNTGTISADSVFFIGAATSASEQAVLSGSSNDGAATSQTMSYARAGELIAIAEATAVSMDTRAELSTMLSNGFRLNWTEKALATLWKFNFVAIKGGRFKIGDLLTQTDTVTSIAETSFGFIPSAAMFFSHMKAQNASDTVSDHDSWSVGAFSSTSDRRAAAIMDQDNAGTAVVSAALEHDEVYINLTTAGAVQGLMDISSIDSDGFTAIMDDADPSQNFVWYFAVGASATTHTVAATVNGSSTVVGDLAVTHPLEAAVNGVSTVTGTLTNPAIPLTANSINETSRVFGTLTNPAILSKVGSFNTTTAAVGNTVAVTGLGFQPKLVILWWNGKAGTVDAVAGESAWPGMGYFTSTTDRGAMMAQLFDALPNGASSTSNLRAQTNSAVVIMGASGGSCLDVQSIDSDGFTLVIENLAFTANRRIHYLALGGSDLTNVAGGNFSGTSIGSNVSQDITGLGFQPDLLLFIGTNVADLAAATAATAMLSIGAANGNDSFVSSNLSRASSSVTETNQYQNQGDAYASFVIGSGDGVSRTLDNRFSLDEFLPDGFRILWSESAYTDRPLMYVALKGIGSTLGTAQTQADTTTDTNITGFRFKPVAGLFFSDSQTAMSASDTPDTGFELSVGGVDSANNNRSEAVQAQTALGTTKITSALEHDEVYINTNTADGVEGRMHVRTINSDGWSMRMTTADPSARYFWYLAFGEAPKVYEIADVNGSSTATANLLVESGLQGTANGAGSVTVELTVDHRVVAAVNAAATVVGALSTLLELSGTINGAATVVGDLAVTHPLEGSASGSSSMTGTVADVTLLSGTSNGVSSVSASDMIVIHQLTSSFGGDSSSEGEMSSDIPVEGDIDASSVITGNLTAEWAAEALIDAESNVEGDMEQEFNPAGNMNAEVDGISTMYGLFNVTNAAAASSDGVSSVVADLSIKEPISLSGTITTTSAVSGMLIRTLHFAGTMSSTSTVIGLLSDLATEIGEAAAHGDSSVTASLQLIGAAHVEPTDLAVMRLPPRTRTSNNEAVPDCQKPGIIKAVIYNSVTDVPIGEYVCDSFTINHVINEAGTFNFSISASQSVNVMDMAQPLRATLYVGNRYKVDGLVDNIGLQENTFTISCNSGLQALTRIRAKTNAKYEDAQVVAIFYDLLTYAPGWSLGEISTMADPLIRTTIDLRGEQRLFAQMTKLTESIPDMWMRYGGDQTIDLGFFDKRIYPAITEADMPKEIQRKTTFGQLTEKIEAYGGDYTEGVDDDKFTLDLSWALLWDPTLATHPEFPIELDNGTYVVRNVNVQDGVETVERFTEVAFKDPHGPSTLAKKKTSYALWQRTVAVLKQQSAFADEWTIETNKIPCDLKVGDRVFIQGDALQMYHDYLSGNISRVSLGKIQDWFRVMSYSETLSEDGFTYGLTATPNDTLLKTDALLSLFDAMRKKEDPDATTNVLEVPEYDILSLAFPAGTTPNAFNGVTGDFYNSRMEIIPLGTIPVGVTDVELLKVWTGNIENAEVRIVEEPDLPATGITVSVSVDEDWTTEDELTVYALVKYT